MGSPASISIESIGSDVESTISIDSDKAPAPAPETYHIPQDMEGKLIFSPGDGDFNLCVNGTVFHTHKYLLKRFTTLERLIQESDSNRGSYSLSWGYDASDFFNTFKILYASPIKALPDFDHLTLVSAVRTSTDFDYPELRTFAIAKLESMQLDAIDRIRYAREFGIPAWEIPAYEELCGREEPITEDEAIVLGIGVFVQVAKIRESEQRRRGENRHQGETCPETMKKASQVIETNFDHESTSNQENGGALVPGEVASDVQNLSLDNVEEPVLGQDAPAGYTAKGIKSKLKPCFIGTSLNQRRDSMCSAKKHLGTVVALDYRIPGCKCRYTKSSKDENGETTASHHTLRCKISPCAADAFEQLQQFQISQAANIMQIESAIQSIKSSMVTPEPAAAPDEPALIENDLELTHLQLQVRRWLAGALNIVK
ncbi:hypothetical protein RhiJN_21774 [Ceratobasidium sp. AG-Ba]|nr:hypothetical protein RhiJN_21774 [Ceratobasidium sp. AG-Ba]